MSQERMVTENGTAHYSVSELSIGYFCVTMGRCYCE
jgi:hypothetical protein